MVTVIPPRPMFLNLKGFLPFIFGLLSCVKILILLHFLRFFLFFNKGTTF